MELETPSISAHSVRSPVQQRQIAVRQRPVRRPTHLLKTTDTALLIGASPALEARFHHVFGPLARNKQILDYVSPALSQFADAKSSCIIGYGLSNAGTSWTMGTDPTSNGIIPAFYRYLSQNMTRFFNSFSYVDPTGRPVRTSRFPLKSYYPDTKYELKTRQDLKRFLQAARTKSYHLVIWFIDPRSSARIAIVDLAKHSESLFTCLRAFPEAPLKDEDALVECLKPALTSDSFVTLLICVSEYHGAKQTLEVINHGLYAADEAELWKSELLDEKFRQLSDTWHDQEASESERSEPGEMGRQYELQAVKSHEADESITTNRSSNHDAAQNDSLETLKASGDVKRNASELMHELSDSLSEQLSLEDSKEPLRRLLRNFWDSNMSNFELSPDIREAFSIESTPPPPQLMMFPDTPTTRRNGSDVETLDPLEPLSETDFNYLLIDHKAYYNFIKRYRTEPEIK